MKIDLRLVSPLEKIFPDEPPRGGYLRASALKNAVASFQAARIAPEGPMPVSYTHLDVYQRQVWGYTGR